MDEQQRPTQTPMERVQSGLDGTDQRPRRRWSRPCGAVEGQGIIEFALVSVSFLLIVFGTLDFGRAIYLQSQLENAVRDAARDMKTVTANGDVCGTGITDSAATNRVRKTKNPAEAVGCGQGEYARPGLETATATVSCSPSCTSGGTVTVTGYLSFQAITQDFLGISPLTLSASATVFLE